LLLTTPLTPGEIAKGTLDSLRWRFRTVAAFVLSLDAVLMLCGFAGRQWNARALFVYFGVWLFLLTWAWDLGHRWVRVFPAMWASLNCGRPAYAVWRAWGNVGSGSRWGPRWWYWVWLLNIYNLTSHFHIFGRGFRQFPSGSGVELMLTSLFVLFWLVWLFTRGFTGSGKVGDCKWDSRAKVWLPVRSPNLLKHQQIDQVCHGRLINEFRDIVREPLPEPNHPGFKKWDAREPFPWPPVKFEPDPETQYSPGDEEIRMVAVTIVELARSGDKGAAVKLARQLYGSTLAEAVEFVENLQSGDGKPPEPGRKPAPPG